MLLDHTTAFENYLSVDHVACLDMAVSNLADLDAPATGRPQMGGVLPGLLIETESGFRQARSLRPGDKVQSYDGGLREIVKIRHSVPRLTAMVHVPAGVLGNDADVTLPSDMLIGLDDATADALFGRPVVMTKLVALIGHHGISAALPQRMPRIHIECEEEELLWAEGGMILNASDVSEDGFYELLSFEEARRFVAAGEDTAVKELLPEAEQAAEAVEAPKMREDSSAGFGWPFAMPLKAPRFGTLDLLFGRYAA